jgi:hypothetical protein
MRRVVSHQERTDHANDTLRALVRMLARAAAREALAATLQTEDKAHGPSLPREGKDHGE